MGYKIKRAEILDINKEYPEVGRHIFIYTKDGGPAPAIVKANGIYAIVMSYSQKISHGILTETTTYEEILVTGLITITHWYYFSDEAQKFIPAGTHPQTQ